MRRAIALLALAACDPRSFDGLQDGAWVQAVDKIDTETSGDFGIQIAPLAATSGAVLLVGAKSYSGLVRLTFDAHGALTDRLGYEATAGSGPLSPLSRDQPPLAIAAWGPGVLVAAPGVPQLVSYDSAVENTGKAATTATLRTWSGLAMAVGDLGFGSAKPDVVLGGLDSVTLLRGGGGTPVTCASDPPSYQELMALSFVTTARLAGGHDQVVVSDSSGHIRAFEAAKMVDGKPCPNAAADVVLDLTASPPATTLTFADVDGDGKLDLVTGAVVKDGLGAVTVYPSLGAPVTIPTDPSEGASGSRGVRIAVASLDGKDRPEIIVGDPSATVSHISDAGQVQIYRYGTEGCPAGAIRNKACLVQTLFDTEPTAGTRLGRALATAPFPDPTSKQSILAIGMQNAVWVYFRAFADAPDPRRP